MDSQGSVGHRLRDCDIQRSTYVRVNWVRSQHGICRLQVADGESQIWRVAANVLKKQSRTDDKEVRQSANNSP